MYEVIVRNRCTNKIWKTDGGNFHRENAESDALVVEEELEDYYCEVREEKTPR